MEPLLVNRDHHVATVTFNRPGRRAGSTKRLVELVGRETTTRLRNDSVETADYAEGVRAFLVKRTPDFR